MLSKLLSGGLIGIEGYIIDIEVNTSFSPVPSFEMVGLPGAAIKEARERVRIAIRNSGLAFTQDKIVVNLAPADTRKEGPCYDLPIAVGILAATGQLQLNFQERVMFLGELSLDGSVKPVRGVLPLLLSCRNRIDTVVLPRENCREAMNVPGIRIVPVSCLREVYDQLRAGMLHPLNDADMEKMRNELSEKNVSHGPQPDFSEVKGQRAVKRAMEICAGGSHSLLMVGPPGSGKTMLAKRLPSILPDMTPEEAIETTMIYSAAGALAADEGLITQRVFRSPHHTSSAAALAGGGGNPRPGEVSMAHNGVLFLDELPEFDKHAIEVLRQPIEDGVITISRATSSVSYPARFTLVASMNPCPCGYYGDAKHRCTCNSNQVKKYWEKLSGPMLDRFDLHIEVPAMDYKELTTTRPEESSADIKLRVAAARERQLVRYKDINIYCNSQLQGGLIFKYCALSTAANNFLTEANERLNFSNRANTRLMKVARTIADLDDSDTIEELHIIEAVRYRSLDGKYTMYH